MDGLNIGLYLIGIDFLPKVRNTDPNSVLVVFDFRAFDVIKVVLGFLKRPFEQLPGAYNRAICMRGGLLKVRGPVDGKCPEGAPELRSSEMLHVWFLRHPGGRFGTNMALSRAELDLAIAERAASENASP